MNVTYTKEVMDIFASPRYVYTQEEYNLLGHAGDTAIGEYVHLYFQLEKKSNYADSLIVSARFSAIGSVLLIATADKLCSLVEGKTFQEAIGICSFDNLRKTLSAPVEKTHSVNYVTMAFYNALETLTNS